MTDLADTPIPLDLDDPVELLSFVPYQFGFHLADSFVILTSRREAGAKQLGVPARVATAARLEPGLAQHGRASVRAGPAAELTRAGLLFPRDEQLSAALTPRPPGGSRNEGRGARL